MSASYYFQAGIITVFGVCCAGACLLAAHYLDSPMSSANDVERLTIEELPLDPPGTTCSDFSDFLARERVYQICLTSTDVQGLHSWQSAEQRCADTAERFARRRLCVRDDFTPAPLNLRGRP